ncbi:toll-like receptor 6 [Sitophilus oryzae]|uniref:Toll-like receptor 6 n=1 Tax=Sitophilus oryzae TaxID=7048 RepID=A0A6J2Y7R8_SITOR|nr:toll-like receptor 6 [Sitophilus oryzae]
MKKFWSFTIILLWVCSNKAELPKDHNCEARPMAWDIFYSIQEVNCTYINSNNFASITNMLRNRYGQIGVLYISNVNISVLLPFQTTEIMKILSLTNDLITDIDPTFFNSCPQLRDLNLARNNISQINGGLFYKLNNLEKLNLSQNVLNDIDGHLLLGIDHLKILDLSENRIVFLPSNIFYSQRSLRKLYLNNNLITTLSTDVFKNLDLSFFNLNGNKLQELITSTQSIKVKCLYMSNTTLGNEKLLSFSQFFNSSVLEELDVSFNNISSLYFQTFKNMSNLTVLYINDNLLDSVEDYSKNSWFNIFNTMPRLRNVSLDNNMWNCHDLKEVLHILTAKQVYVARGNHFNESNMLGIRCRINDQKYNISLSKGTLADTNFNENISQILERLLKNVDDVVVDMKKKENDTMKLGSKIENMSKRITQLESTRNQTTLEILKNVTKEIEKNNRNLEQQNNLKKAIEDLQNFKKEMTQNSILDTKEKAGEANASNFEKKLNQIRSIIPKMNSTYTDTSNSQLSELDKLLLERFNKEDNNFGEIFTIFLLSSIACMLAYFCYFIYKQKFIVNQNQREQINLV